MPNKHIRKTDRGLVSTEVFSLAADEVLNNRQSLRNVAKSYKINYISLYRFVEKRKSYCKKARMKSLRLVILATEKYLLQRKKSV